MKKSLSILFCGIAFLVFGSNPLNFPEYKQTVTVTYPTPEKAKEATLQILPLPGGKKIAYTSRWDDTNALNLKMSELLKKHGMKGTFMLHNTNYKEQGKKLLEAGHAIGNHTIHHYRLTLVNPNQLFYEVAVYQINLETELQTSVVSFVYPFGPGADLFKDFPGTCMKVFDCANLYVFPFYWRNANNFFKRPKDSLFATRLFSSNDRKPTAEFYRQQLAKAKKEVDPAFARITHGIHVWMTPAGFEELDRAFTETAKDPDFVFLTENEYGAYRYSALHANMKRTDSKSASAVFELTRFQPGHLGSEIPLSLKITPAPEKVEMNGIRLQQDKNGFWILPHSPGKTMPAFYEWLKEKESGSKKLPGLNFELAVSKDLHKFTIKLTNKTGKDLKNLHFQLSLPPRWIEHKQMRSIERLNNGDSLQFEIDAGKTVDDPDFAEGIYYFIGRLDFDGGRIYRTISVSGTKPGEGIHTQLRYLGPFPKAALTDELIKKISLPGKLEPVIYQGKTYRWKRYRSTQYNRYSFDLRSIAYRNNALGCPVVADFIMPEDGEVKIAMYCGTEFYCNGVFVGKQRKHYKIKAKKGRNRLYFPNAIKFESIVIYPPGKLVAPEE